MLWYSWMSAIFQLSWQRTCIECAQYSRCHGKELALDVRSTSVVMAKNLHWMCAVLPFSWQRTYIAFFNERNRL